MKRLLVSLLAVMATSFAVHAQKQVLESAKAALAAGKLADAEKFVVQALANDETKNNPDTWSVAGNIQYAKGEEQLKKAYRKQPYDTLTIYNSALETCRYFMACDSMAQIPDSKGKVRNRLRKSNAETAADVKANLINGGIYFYNKAGDEEQNSHKALDFFGMYVDLTTSPLMSKQELSMSDSVTLWRTAYYAEMAAMRLKDYNSVIKYYNKAASKDSENGRLATLYCAQAYKAIDDKASEQTVLERGIEKYPDDEPIFMALIDRYTTTKDYGKALALADKMTVKYSDNFQYFYIMGYLQFSLRIYDKALELFEKAISLNNNYAEAYSNIGLIYRIKAQNLTDKSKANVNDADYDEEQDVIHGYYQQARLNYEMARKLAPDNKELWVDGLYSVYYNLKMGREFEEIERLR